MRSVIWNNNDQAIELIDQRLLPWVFTINQYKPTGPIRCHKEMVVGAPAIGAAAAYGMAPGCDQLLQRHPVITDGFI